MMAGVIHPYLYEVDEHLLKDSRIVIYSMPLAVYNAIKQAQGIPEEHIIAYSSLQIVLGWAAPSIDLIGVRFNPDLAQKTLTLTAINPIKSADEIRLEIELAVSIWLGIVMPEKSAEISKISNGTQWACIEQSINSEVNWNGNCISPHDYNVFDLISLIAARALEGKTINSKSFNEGELVLSGAQQSLYSGKSLIRYAPTRIEKGKNSGWATEIFNVASLSTPGSHSLRVAINVGVRNFGEIHESRLGKYRARYMDAFIPANSTLAPNSGRIRCLELPTTRQDWWFAGSENDKESPNRRVMKNILGLSGIDFDEKSLGLKPLISESISLYPRFGTIHGDQWAPGGTGISHPERQEYLEFLDDNLGSQGFTRVQMNRVNRKAPKEKLVTPLGHEPEDVQTALMRRFGDQGATLNLLQANPAGIELFSNAVKSILGEPSMISENIWTLENGFSINIQNKSAGPFSQLLDSIDESKLANIQKNIRQKVRNQLFNERDKLARETMSAYLDNIFLSLPASWMGLVEMNKALMVHSERDPYLLTYQTIASKNGVAQVRLFDLEDKKNEQSNDDDINPDLYAYQNSILDLFRSAGVSPVREQQTRLAAWWMINRNDRSGQHQAGEKGGFCSPVYMECDNGAISVCLMGHDDQPIRCTYPEAIRLISTGQIANLKFKKANEQSVRVTQFFAQATPHDGRKTIIFVEATNIRSAIPGFRNSDQFLFDHLRLGNIGGAAPVREIRPSDGISIIRITDEAAKAPCYWVEQSTQGTTAGIFCEPDSSRTFWLSRGLPTPLQLSSVPANKMSRHEIGPKQYKNRHFPSLSEVTVVVKGQDDDIWELITLTRAMMQCHIATDEKTILPFPLHEVSLLADAAR